MTNNVFFGTEGLSSTSANFYANMAQEMIVDSVQKLQNVQFYDVDICSLQNSTPMPMSKGTKDLDFIENTLMEVGEMNAFCAWIREAIKEKDDQIKNIDYLSFEDWCNINNIEFKIPEVCSRPKTVTIEDIIKEWPAEKINKYYTLEAMAATFGKYIHPKGAFSKAREQFHGVVNNPIIKEDTNTNILLYYRNPSVSTTKVENVFLNLQKTYRSYEKELNFLKAELKNQTNKRNLDNKINYEKELHKYETCYAEYTNKKQESINTYNAWKITEQERISNLKIIIPKSLEKIFLSIKNRCDTSK